MDKNERVTWVIVTIVLMGIGLYSGLLLGGILVKQRVQDAAFERGYAEWVLPEGGRGKSVWRWIEPELDREEN